jgi:hypothetical protein
VARGEAGGRQHQGRWRVVTMPPRHHCVHARPLAGHAAMGRRWPLARGPLNFSLNFDIDAKFEIQNEGLTDVQKYSNFASR